MNDINNISMLQIEIFLTVAESHSISEAAKKLFISQSAATRWIQKLETCMNVKLFLRANKGIELTDDGRRLYLQIKHLYTKMRAIFFDTCRATEGRGHTVNAACLNTNEVIEEMSRMVNQFHFFNNEINININLVNFQELHDGMLSRKFDCAFTYSVSSSNFTEMEFQRSKHMDTYFAVSSKSPAIVDDKLNYSILSKSYMYIHPIKRFDLMGKRDISICRSHGFTPKGIRYISDARAIEGLVRDENGFSIAGPEFGMEFDGDIRLFKVEKAIDEEQYIGILWNPTECSPETWKLVQFVPYMKAIANQ